MKLTLAILLSTLFSLAVALPWKFKIALHNSLEVGRNEDPMLWQCAGCDDSTKPLTTHVIEEKGMEVKSILSVYEEYTVLAFRYTANVKNVAQDILWAFQVDF